MELRQNNTPGWYILEDERQEFEKKLQDNTIDENTRARIARILREARILNPENGTVSMKSGIVNIGKTVRYKVQSLLSENTFEWTFRIGGNESPIPWRIPHDTPFAAKFKGRQVDEDNSIFTVDKKVFKYSNLDLASPESAWMQSEPNDEVEIELVSSEWVDR